MTDVVVNIHRCLGRMEDVDDIKSIEAHGDAMSSPEDYEDDEDENAGVEHVSIHATTAPSTQAPSLHVLYEEHVQKVPEHISTLLDATLSQLEGEEEDEKKAITLLLIAYQDIFAVDETDIGKTDVITHDVDTGGCKPVCQPLRRQSKEEHEAMVSIVNNLRRCGIIQPSRSQWAANIRMAKKKSGQWRMCIDY